MVRARYPIKVDLAEEQYEILKKIKEHYGLDSFAETIRLTIKRAYDQIQKGEDDK